MISVDLSAIGVPQGESVPNLPKLESFESYSEEFEFYLLDDVKDSKVRKHLFKFFASLI